MVIPGVGEYVFIHSYPFWYKLMDRGQASIPSTPVDGLWRDEKSFRIGPTTRLYVHDSEPRDRETPSPDPSPATIRSLRRTHPDWDLSACGL